MTWPFSRVSSLFGALWREHQEEIEQMLFHVLAMESTLDHLAGQILKSCAIMIAHLAADFSSESLPASEMASRLSNQYVELIN